ncbi:hypothetical protein AB4427_12990 [Vibrio artabrorum]|uniref:hypothetical protein n=1 Tax=Vibrio TaxID=662 RepID=UPI000C817B45|nr:hypothetical protein [Vibrio lentus]PMM22723.1 hypothetical protein BCT58_15975 [Vibrio lentus]
MDNEMNTVQIPAEKLVDALLHAKQFEHHYATQESVDNLKESVRELKADTNKRFDEMKSDTAKQFDEMKSHQVSLRDEIRNTNNNTNKILLLIVGLCLTALFKEQLLSLFM